MKTRLARGGVLAVAVALALGLAACGSSSGPGSASSPESASSSGSPSPSGSTSSSESAPAGTTQTTGGPATIANDWGLKADTALWDRMPDQYKKNGVKAAVFNDDAPTSFLQNGKTVGFAVDISTAMSALTGVPFSYEPTGFEVMLPGIKSNRYDLGVVAFAPLADRRKVLDFIPIAESALGFAIKADSTLQINARLDLCGLVVGAQTGTSQLQDVQKISSECVAAGKPAVDIKEFKTASDANLAVEAGRTQVTTASATTMAYQVKTTGKLKMAGYVNKRGVDYRPGMGVRNDDPLGPILVDALKELIDNGTYGKIMEKWGVSQVALSTEVGPITLMP